MTAQSILPDPEILSNYCAVIVLSTKVMKLIHVIPTARVQSNNLMMPICQDTGNKMIDAKGLTKFSANSGII